MEPVAALAVTGILAPLAVSLELPRLARHHLPAAASRHAEGASFALASLLGCALLPDPPPLLPERHWHWLPHIALAASVLDPVGRHHPWLHPLIRPALALVASWLLVPDWPDLAPWRPHLVLALSFGLLVLMAGLDALGTCLPARRFMAALSLTAAALAALIAIHVSFTYGRLALPCAPALAGLLVHRGLSARSLVAPCALLLGGLAFVAALDPTPPRTALLLVPFAPLLLGPTRILPTRSQSSGA